MLEIDIQSRLRDFDLQVCLKVSEGEILMLMGENGCGKTTVLNAVAGLLTPERGEIVLDDRILFDSENRINLPPDQRNIGYVFQNYALFPHMSIYDNLAFGLRSRRLDAEEVTSRVKRQLESFDLWDIRNAKASQISGGQKQRTALARALVIEPDLLLLDEPLSSMDIMKQAAMRRELRKRVRNCGVPSIMVTHDPRDVSAIGDHVYLMEKGKVVKSSRAQDISSWGDAEERQNTEKSIV